MAILTWLKLATSGEFLEQNTTTAFTKKYHMVCVCVFSGASKVTVMVFCVTSSYHEKVL
jgi:hypothetical protein